MASIQRMVHKVWLVFLIIALLFSFTSIRAEAGLPEARTLFQKLLQSIQTVDFQGRIVFMSAFPDRNAVVEAMVTRKAPDKQKIEFISPDDIKGSGFVFNGEDSWPIRGGRRPQRRPIPPFLPIQPGQTDGSLLNDVQLLIRNYDINVLDGGNIADRSTYMIELNPKTDGRPSRKIWLDSETGVILKTEHYDPQKKLKWLFVYNKINFNPSIDESIFRKPDRMPERRPPEDRIRKEIWSHAQGKLDVDKLRKEARMDVIVPDRDPAGFVLQGVQVVEFDGRKNVHLKYNDGLTVLSVFQSTQDEEKRRGREPQPPPDEKAEKLYVDGTELKVFSRGPMLIFRWNTRGIFLTMMGEISQKEMIEIAKLFIKK